MTKVEWKVFVLVSPASNFSVTEISVNRKVLDLNDVISSCLVFSNCFTYGWFFLSKFKGDRKVGSIYLLSIIYNTLEGLNIHFKN